MFTIGLVLLIIGIVVVLLGLIPARSGAAIAPGAANIGWLLVGVGIILIFLSVLLDAGTADAMAAGAAMMMAPLPHAIPPSQDPPEPLPGERTSREPVVIAFLVAAVVLQVLDLAGAETPLWLRTALTGLGGLVGSLAAAWARSRVTPIALPRLDDETPLVPMVEREDV
jgi:hypothetical protein